MTDTEHTNMERPNSDAVTTLSTCGCGVTMGEMGGTGGYGGCGGGSSGGGVAGGDGGSDGVVARLGWRKTSKSDISRRTTITTVLLPSSKGTNVLSNGSHWTHSHTHTHTHTLASYLPTSSRPADSASRWHSSGVGKPDLARGGTHVVLELVPPAASQELCGAVDV